MQSLIQQIVDDIQTSRGFDSHFVIEELGRRHSANYTAFVSSHGGDVPVAHSLLSKMVGQCRNVQRLLGPTGDPLAFYSVNIRGNANDNAAWMKI
jgi:hypothetical protein